MRSWQSKLVDIFLRLVSKGSGKRSPDVLVLRNKMASLDKRIFRSNPALTVPRNEQAPVPFVRLNGGRDTCQTVNASDRFILYLHGGGFVASLPNGQANMVDRWCRALGVSAIMPFYRLAPEYPFPAAPDDCFAMYRWLLSLGVDAKNLVIAGDSAGGCLTLATLHRIKAERLPMPRCAVLLSPASDLTMSGKSVYQNAKSDAMFNLRDLIVFRNAYAREKQLVDPYASPLFADFAELPPLFLHACSSEILLDDSTRVYEKAKRAGVDVELKIWPHLPHVFQVLSFLPETATCNGLIVDFIEKYTGWALASSKLSVEPL